MRQVKPWICTNPECQTKLKQNNCLPWRDEGYFCLKCYKEKLFDPNNWKVKTNG